jgi:hypothetical protein
MKTKRRHEKAVRVNITIQPLLFNASEELVKKYGFNGLSDYIQARIRQDAGLELPGNKLAA